MSQPAYRDIADAIRGDIESRRLVEGDRLPTVRGLAAEHGVPTGTVAKAIELLRAEGIVGTRHGRGLYVRKFARILRSSPKRLSREHWGTGNAIQDADTGQRLRVVNVEVTEVPATEVVSEALSVPFGAAVLIRERRFAVDGRVVQLSTSYIPLDVVALAPAVAYTGPGPGGIYARMADVGLGPEKFRERLIIRPPNNPEKALLDLPDSTWVIEISRCAYTSTDRCVEMNVMVLDASAYVLEYRFAANED